MRRGLAAALTALVIAGCTAPAAAPDRSAAPERGGTVVVAAQEPATLDPVRSTGTQSDSLVFNTMLQGLLRLDAEGRWAPWLAERVPTLANGDLALASDGSMTVRYVLRTGLAWSDGVPLTSDDVRFTWQRVMSDPRASTREGYDLITAVETPDARTAVVRYRRAYPGFTSRFSALVPRHVLDGAPETAVAAFGRAPVGVGPFRFVEWVSADHLTVERAVAGAPTPYLDRIVFRFMPSVNAAKAQLRAGEVQASLTLGESDVADLADVKDLVVDARPSPLVEALTFAVDRPVVSDPAVRRALALATPRDAIVTKLLGGTARVGTGELPLGWAAPPRVAPAPEDPAGAARLLESAGWRPGSDGIRVKDGQRLRLEITSTTGNPVRERVEQVLVDAWRAIGAEATIRNVPGAQLTAPWASNGIRKRGTFDVLLAQVGLGAGEDPQSYLAARRRCDAVPSAQNNGAGSNWERYCDPQVDALLDRAGSVLDEATRASLYAQALARLNDAAVNIWLFDHSRVEALHRDVRGHQGNAWMPATYDADRWWLAR